jgi:hypothetical protein
MSNASAVPSKHTHKRKIQQVAEELKELDTKRQVLNKELLQHPDYKSYKFKFDFEDQWDRITSRINDTADRKLDLLLIKTELLAHLTSVPVYRKSTTSGHWGFARVVHALSYEWNGKVIVYSHADWHGESGNTEVTLTVDGKYISEECDNKIIEKVEVFGEWCCASDDELKQYDDGLDDQAFLNFFQKPEYDGLLLYGLLVSAAEPSSRKSGWDFSFINTEENRDEEETSD